MVVTLTWVMTVIFQYKNILKGFPKHMTTTESQYDNHISRNKVTIDWGQRILVITNVTISKYLYRGVSVLSYSST